MRIAVIGPGYVGLPTAAVFAELGNTVFLVGRDAKKNELLKQGKVYLHENGLQELVERNLKAGRFIPTLSYADAIPEADVVFIAVGTPSGELGEADLTAVFAAAKEVAQYLSGYTVVVNKSTVPVGTAEKVARLIADVILRSEATKDPLNQGAGSFAGAQDDASRQFDMASCPEFLREGTAVEDAFHPDRIVIGVDSDRARDVLLALHKPLPGERVVTDPKSAELIKYASNAFLATKISFINEIANICESVGADVEEVARGMGLDSRIGPKFLKAGAGWSGSCLLGDERVFLRDERGYLHRLRIQDAVQEFLAGTFGKAELLSFDQKKQRLQFARITGVSARPYNGIVVRATTKMGRTVAMTADHPCVTFEDGRMQTVLAKDLTTKDHLLLMSALPQATYTKSFDLIDILLQQSKFDIGQVKCRSRHRALRTIPGIRVLLQKYFSRSKSYGGRDRDIVRSNCLTVAEFLIIERALRLYIKREDLVLFTQNSGTYCPVIFPITNETARLVGYYLSEGHIHEEREGRVRTQWSFHEDEGEYIKDVTNILQRLDVQYDVWRKKKDHTVCIVVSSRIFGFLLSDVLQCGKTSYDARIPSCLFGAPKTFRRSVLQGLFRGDGHIAFPNHSPAVVLDFGTISNALRDGMVELFQSLGYIASTKRSRSKKSSGWAHFLRISGEAQVRELLDFKDRKTGERAFERLGQYKRHIAQTGFSRLNRDVAIVRIRDLQKKKRETTVYSFEVAKIHTFVTSGGIIVHNCFPKDVRALHHIAFSNHYESQILKAVIEVNNDQRRRIIAKLAKELGDLHGKEIVLLGLAFKPHTDDIRESAAIDLLYLLKNTGARVRLHDPVARPDERSVFLETVFHDDPYAACAGADACVIATEWPEFKVLDWDRIKQSMRQSVLIDGRNLLDPKIMRAMGWTYISVGRP